MPNFPRLEPNQIYHVCSRGNNREDIFLEEHDRRHFLELLEARVSPQADTFAYCLLPTHFHLLLRFRDSAAETAASPSRMLADMLNAYARSFNLDHKRTGALFQRPFRRVPVRSQIQLVYVVTYIHHNPGRHGLQDDFRTWRYSSYRTLLATTPTRLARDEVLGWFGGRDGFRTAHTAPVESQLDRALLLEGGSAATT